MRGAEGTTVQAPEMLDSIEAKPLSFMSFVLEQNEDLLTAVAECQQLGRVNDAVQYQQLLQKNLIVLAQLCDSQEAPVIPFTQLATEELSAMEDRPPRACVTIPSQILPPEEPHRAAGKNGGAGRGMGRGPGGGGVQPEPPHMGVQGQVGVGAQASAAASAATTFPAPTPGFSMTPGVGMPFGFSSLPNVGPPMALPPQLAPGAPPGTTAVYYQTPMGIMTVQLHALPGQLHALPGQLHALPGQQQQPMGMMPMPAMPGFPMPIMPMAFMPPQLQPGLQPAAPVQDTEWWTSQEHQRAVEAVKIYGIKNCKAIADYVGTKTRQQVRYHIRKSPEFKLLKPAVPICPVPDPSAPPKKKKKKRKRSLDGEGLMEGSGGAVGPAVTPPPFPMPVASFQMPIMPPG